MATIDHVSIIQALGQKYTFYEWVGGLKAGDNPRGDFIRDTRTVMESGTVNRYEVGMCWEAQEEREKLARRWLREESIHYRGKEGG